MSHHKKYNDDIAGYHIGSLNATVDENRTLAHLTFTKICWFIDDGRPVAEIKQFDKIIWRESFAADYFHLAYANMLHALNRKLKQIDKHHEETRAKVK